MTIADGDAASDAIHRPDPATARDVVASAIADGDLITVFGRCRVEYEGRAASTLGPGDRLVVLKPDGTALVHTDEGQKPVNWQPPGCSHEVGVTGEDGLTDGDGVTGEDGFTGGDGGTDEDGVTDEDGITDEGGLTGQDGTHEEGQFQIRSVRSSPEEELLVTFERVEQISTFDVTDRRDLALTGTEEDLRQRILDDPDLVEAGFRPLATERETPAGAVDIYGQDAEGATVVVELKRKRVGPDAVGQLGRYVESLERDLHADAEIRGFLVAPSVTERARNLLAEKGLEFVSLGPPE